MKKTTNKIKLIKALAFPVSAWFAFTLGTAVVNAEETNVANVGNQDVQTVEMTSLEQEAIEQSEDSNSLTEQKSTENQIVEKDSVSYETHVQDIGWQSAKEDGEVAGTTGQSKRVEAIKINLDSQYEGNVNYQAHVQDIGWQNTVTDGQLAGTTNQSKRVEALRIWLTGDISNHYSIQYRVHVSNIGWLDWVSDGMLAGTTGRNLKIEGLQIRLTDLTSRDLLQYTTHVQGIGWQNAVTEGQLAGTTNQSKRVEGIRVYYNDSQYSGTVQYQAHVQDIGWQATVSNGGLAGTTNQSKRVEAIRFMLSGEVAQHYDIYYRVHVQDYGWLDWASNGAISGTTKQSKRIEAIEIKLLEKGSQIASNGVTSIEDGKSYINGKLADGWQDINGKKYYFNEGKKQTGYQTIDGNKYYFHSNGVMAVNERKDCNYADENGVLTEQHNWVAQTKTVHHAEVGHNEQVLVQSAYDEQSPVYTNVAHDICNVCGADITSNASAHTKAHALAGEGGGWHTQWTPEISGYDTIHHDAQYTTQYVVDQQAYDETVTTGYICSTCGKSSSSSSSSSQHTHNWVAQTKTVHHAEVGHNEQVLVQAAYDEQVPQYGMVEHTLCSACGQDLTNLGQSGVGAHIKSHALNGENAGYYSNYVQEVTGYETVHHEAQYSTQYVVDQQAYDETVTTGYICSTCGKTK